MLSRVRYRAAHRLWMQDISRYFFGRVPPISEMAARPTCGSFADSGDLRDSQRLLQTSRWVHVANSGIQRPVFRLGAQAPAEAAAILRWLATTRRAERRATGSSEPLQDQAHWLKVFAAAPRGRSRRLAGVARDYRDVNRASLRVFAVDLSAQRRGSGGIDFVRGLAGIWPSRRP